MAKKVEKTPLKKGKSDFMLIGEAKINDFTFKMDQESSKSDWEYHQLNLGVDCGNGNTVYCEMMGGYGTDRDNVLYVHGVKEENGKKTGDWDNKFQIAWEDRFDEKVLETVDSMCFIKVGIEKDSKDKTFTKRFLSEYDAIEYIKEHLEDGMVVNVKGNLAYSMYNESVQIRKQVKSIFLSKVDDPSKYKATFTQSILVDKDSIGKVDKEKACFPITARVIDYTKMWNDKEVKTSVPFTKVFELEVDKENPEHTKAFLNKIFKVKKDVTEVQVEGDIVEGQAIIDIAKEDLPEDIQELISWGVFSEEEALKKAAGGNNKEKRMIIRKPVVKLEGDDDNKIPVIQKFERKYTEDDLILDFMLGSDEDDDNDDEASFVTLSKDEDEEEEVEESGASWLDALDD